MIAIISDIHGNYPALKAVYEEIKKRGIPKIICLGDVCGYYSQINECINLVRLMTDKFVLGNHDAYMIFNKRCPRSNSANQCLDYQHSVIKKEYIDWLKMLPEQAVYYGINCVHGGWNNFLDEYIYEQEYFTDKHFDEKFLVSGHSHKPFVLYTPNLSYCNVGSVGQPRDGDYRASFAILNDEGMFEIIRVEYDYKTTQEAMKQAGFPEYFYKNLAFGLPIGAKVE